ncbi:CREB/ATF bZIP transcription factor [Discoglossus pictus]
MRHRLRDRSNMATSLTCRRRALRQPAARLTQPRRTAVRGERKAVVRRVAMAESNFGQITEQSLAMQNPVADINTDKAWLNPGAPYEGVFLSGVELDDLLGVQEEGSDLFNEAELADDEPLAELLQQLVGCVDVTAPTHTQAEMRPSVMAADPGRRTNNRCPSNKNALAARLNRLRKKEYVSGLETQVTRLAEENQQLQLERRSLGARVRELEVETRYLRAVLANDSALSQLLGRLTGLGGVKLSTSLFKEQPTGGDHDYALPGIVQEVRHAHEEPGGGVCLHVDKEKVSVEFCSQCARNASSAAKIFFFR